MPASPPHDLNIPRFELTSVIRRNDGVVQRDIAGETLLVPVRGRLAALAEIFALNPVGVYIWRQIDGQRDLGTILKGLTEEFDVPSEEAHADLLEYVEKLREAGLVSSDTAEDTSSPKDNSTP